MTIRPAQQEDAAALARMNAAFNAGTVSPEQIAAYLAHSTEQDRTVVADIDGAAVGFACLRLYRSWCYPAPWAEVTELYVEPAYRRRGLARAMLASLEAIACATGASEIMLLTNPRNSVAQSLYRHCGYREQPECAFHKSLCHPADHRTDP